MTRERLATAFKLFRTIFLLSAMTFGGGYVIISYMRRRFVDELKMLSEDEMMDLAAIAQTAPGSIAVNASILIGYRLLGVAGALISVLAAALPPLIIICVVYAFYDVVKDHRVTRAIMHGMRAAVAAVIVDVALSMQVKLFTARKLVPILIMAAAFVSTYFLKVNVAFILLGSALVGIVYGRVVRARSAI